MTEKKKKKKKEKKNHEKQKKKKKKEPRERPAATTPRRSRMTNQIAIEEQRAVRGRRRAFDSSSNPFSIFRCIETLPSARQSGKQAVLANPPHRRSGNDRLRKPVKNPPLLRGNRNGVTGNIKPALLLRRRPSGASESGQTGLRADRKSLEPPRDISRTGEPRGKRKCRKNSSARHLR
ncbi:MAG: hypothetical protein BJ554DRAFT_3719 [Olpidium bornovanus]|uniref:Uncharacterized protein n=1 Tax=Olpidium bornovanus TaxID=278681 RepID=A0A8H7ZNQ6_9FUNG|nr:MAG: hypothetical protein BJ554DRAFT_3719 [Olpidium bornovanus]